MFCHRDTSSFLQSQQLAMDKKSRHNCCVADATEVLLANMADRH